MAIETLRPNAVGDETNLNPYPNTGEENWEDVDEETPDGGTTFVQYANKTTYARDLYHLPAFRGVGSINKVTVYCYTKAQGAGTIDQASLKCACKTHTTPYEGSEETVTFGWAYYLKEWTTNPNTGSAWTWGEIDALQIGVALKGWNSGTAYNTRCTQVYVEVDYNAPSDGGSGAEALDSRLFDAVETGSGVETLVSRLFSAAEAGSGVEASSLVLAVLAADVGSGLDALKALLETTGSDIKFRAHPGQVKIPSKGVNL